MVGSVVMEAAFAVMLLRFEYRKRLRGPPQQLLVRPDQRAIS
jgi:hypothetical protein